MRVSSAMRPCSSSGTLKSTRSITRLPRTSTSRTVAFSRLAMLEALPDELRKVGDAAGVAPFVVVPGDHLEEVVADEHGGEAIDDRGVRIATEIRGDERLFG